MRILRVLNKTTPTPKPPPIGQHHWNALVSLLEMVSLHDRDYAIRDVFVYRAVALAKSLGLSTGFRMDPDEPAWPVAFIELPTGQVSWHMSEHVRAWDGHDHEEKQARLERFFETFATEPRDPNTPPAPSAIPYPVYADLKEQYDALWVRAHEAGLLPHK